MIEIIVFVLPTFFSLIVHDIINNNEKTVYKVIKIFGSYCCLNNLIAMVAVFLWRKGDFYITEDIKLFGFAFKYFALSCIIGVALPVVIEFIKKNVSIKFNFKEVKNEEKN